MPATLAGAYADDIPATTDKVRQEPAVKKPARSSSERLHIAFTPRMMDRLDQLKQRTEAGSYTELFRNALRVYDALHEEVENGGEICVRRKNGDVVACRFW